MFHTAAQSAKTLVITGNISYDEVPGTLKFRPFEALFYGSTMALEIAEKTAIHSDDWNAFVDDCDEAWLWHRTELIDAFATWDGASDQSFAIRDGGKILAVVPLHLTRGRMLGLVGWNTLESSGGPACANGMAAKQRKKVLTEARGHLEALASRSKARQALFSLPVMAPAWRGERCPRVNPLLDLGCRNTLTQSWVIDLRRPMAEIRRAYSETTRQEIKKAEQSGVSVREARGAADLEAYYELHCETYRRTGATPRTKRYFQNIFDVLVEKNLCRIVFLIKDGAVIAAHNTGLYKGGAVYWTGASRNDKAAGETRLLFDNQLAAARERDCEWYETGEAFPNLQHGKLKGLSDYKKSFGGEIYPFFRGSLPVKGGAGRLLDCYRLLRGVHPDE
jgi:hypothetical protein